MNYPYANADAESIKPVVRKVAIHILPVLILGSFIAYLDRVNVSFAALTMNEDLKLDATTFGWGVGVFFLVYVIFELPSNLAMRRFGPRIWIARIMVAWGIVSACTAFIWNGTSFIILRALLGVAEAGFFPALLLLLATWVPSAFRARFGAWFMIAIPLSTVFGAPTSGLILQYSVWGGLKGWQWLFLIEAAPAILLAVYVLARFPDSLEQATWLSPAERTTLDDLLKAEAGHSDTDVRSTLRGCLTDWRVWMLCAVNFGITGLNYGVGFWLPQIVRSHGTSLLGAGMLTAIPYVGGALAMLGWSAVADRTKLSRKVMVAIPPLLAALGLVLSAHVNDPALKIVCVTVAALGIFAVLPVFWTLPTSFLSGTGAAAGIAIINSVGNLAGFVGPYVVGLFKSSTGSFSSGLMAIAGFGVLSSLCVMTLSTKNRSICPSTADIGVSGEA